MSIVRIGLSETKKFAEGYEAIFGKKKAATNKPAGSSARSAKPKRKAGKKK